MSEMSEGAKAAWERELKQHWPHYADWAALPPVIDMHRKMFAAGFEAALAAIEREAIHLEECTSETSIEEDRRNWRIGRSQILLSVRCVRDNNVCNNPEHQWCQEANKR